MKYIYLYTVLITTIYDYNFIYSITTKLLLLSINKYILLLFKFQANNKQLTTKTYLDKLFPNPKNYIIN